MKANFVIRGDKVMDPVTAIDQIQDIVVSDTRIIDPQGEMVECDHMIDTSSCIVAPDLTDFHTHIFYEGSDTCLRPDFTISQGTTATMDAGTTGTVTCGTFYKSVITQSVVRIKSFLTAFSGGQLDLKLRRNFDPCLINLPRVKQVIDKYRDNILGLRIRPSKGMVPNDKRLECLKRIVDLTEELDNKLRTSLRVCVHTASAPITADELAQCLRPGDIFCHCYQGVDNTIATEDGGISPLVLEARRRGVISGAANGRGNFGVDTARRALTAGFLPDIISSDLTLDKFNIPPYARNLLFVTVKYRTLGMELTDILRAMTAVPTRIMGMKGKIGTLKPKVDTDIVILKQKDLSFTQKGFRDEELASHELLVPQVTMCVKEVNFCQSDFFL